MGLFNLFRKKPRYDNEKGRLAAHTLSTQILQTANQAAFQTSDTVEKASKSQGHDKSRVIQLIFEFTFLFLHISDRIAFQELGPESRGEFMDFLVVKTVINTIEEYFPSPDYDTETRDKIRTRLYSSYENRNIQYGTCRKLFSENQESSKDTVFWEFGKVASNTLLGNPNDLYGINVPMMIGIEVIKDLNIKQCLEGTRH